MVGSEISFGQFRFDLARRELRRDQTLVRLGSRALDILCVLASAEGTVVTKDQLMARVWAGVVVGENNIHVHLSALRRALAEEGDEESWIVTIPGRGYRLLRSPEPSAAGKSEAAAAPSTPAAGEPSLAVLPFLNLSDDPEQEYFADGIAEEIITALSRIRWLFVIARNSSFIYKGQKVNVKRVGRELGVRYVLEGSVRKSGNRVRIAVQLIDADTGAHLWADGFDGSSADVFELQDRVASSVAGAIEPTLEAAEIRRSDARPTTDLTAYDLYLRALAHHRSYEKDRLVQALDLLGRALERDPGYGPALALAAYCHGQLDLNGWVEDREANRRTGLDLARRALRVAADDPDVIAPAAFILGHFGDGIDAAIGLIDRALAARPSFAHGWFWSGNLRLFAGQPDIAIDHFERCRRLSPRDPMGPRCLTGIASAHFFNRRFDDAVKLLLITLGELPTYTPAYRFLAASYAHLGRLDEARAVVARARQITSDLEADAERWFRNPEHRELILSGLHLAAGDDRTVAPPPVKARWPVVADEAPPRADALRDTMPIQREAERRQISAMFCELAGATVRTDGSGLEEWGDAVADFQRCVSKAADRHQGLVYRDLGTSALILFGYPEAHEHDAEQAVRAGLELCAVVRTLRPDAGMPVRCRVGIATGMVIVGDPVGFGTTRGEGIIGDAPNLAARLAALAKLDTVAVEPATRRLIGDLFDCRELSAIDTPGAPEPVRSWQVLGESIVASRFEALRGAALTPLIGRDDEIDLLLRRWARARAGNGQVVLISGEPGIGKSRIAAALAERLGGEPHLRLRYFCSPYRQDSALFPFLDQLGRAAGFSREDSPAAKLEKLEALLARAAPPEEDVALLAELMSLPATQRYPLLSLTPQRKKERILEALIRQLERLAAQEPVLSVFEDAHWVDPTSRELIDLTIERIRSLPALLIVTFRPEFEPAWTGQEQVSTLALNRLDQRDRAALVAQIAGGKALPDQVVAQIVDRTDGVPLFVEELTKSVLESGLLQEEANRWVLDRALPSLAIPTSLHASLMARLDRLAGVRDVAQIGAAIGRQFPYALLRAVCHLPEDELLAALGRLVASGLVSQRGTPPDAVYRFKHALVQDAVHGSLLRDTRRQLHARIADALETTSHEVIENQPEILAQHYAEAGLVEKSVACWYKAGQRSATRSAMAEAAAQFHKALDQLSLLPDAPERRRQELEFWSALGAVLRALKGNAAPETGEAYARAMDLWEQLGSPSAFLYIPYVLSYYHAFRGEFDLAKPLDEALLRLSKGRDDKAGLFLGHFSCGRTLLLTGRFSLSRSHLEAALRFSDPAFRSALVHQTGIDPQEITQAYLGIALFCLGYPEQALARINAAVAAARRLAHPPSLAGCLTIAGVVLVLAGDNAVLGELTHELAAIAAEQGFPYWRAAATYDRGWVKINNGDVSEGISLLRSGMAEIRATGTEAWMPFTFGFVAKGCEIAGQIDEALTHLGDALRIVERTEERWFVAELYRHKGQLLLRQGHGEAAAELYHKALSVAQEQDGKLWELRAAMSLARLRRDEGRSAEARDLLAPVYGWFTEGFATPDLKEAKALLCELG